MQPKCLDSRCVMGAKTLTCYQGRVTVWTLSAIAHLWIILGR